MLNTTKIEDMHKEDMKYSGTFNRMATDQLEHTEKSMHSTSVLKKNV